MTFWLPEIDDQQPDGFLCYNISATVCPILLRQLQIGQKIAEQLGNIVELQEYNLVNKT